MFTLLITLRALKGNFSGNIKTFIIIDLIITAIIAIWAVCVKIQNRFTKK